QKGARKLCLWIPTRAPAPILPPPVDCVELVPSNRSFLCDKRMESPRMMRQPDTNNGRVQLIAVVRQWTQWQEKSNRLGEKRRRLFETTNRHDVREDNGC